MHGQLGMTRRHGQSFKEGLGFPRHLLLKTLLFYTDSTSHSPELSCTGSTRVR